MKYVKKPVEIEAKRFNDYEDYVAIIKWMESSGNFEIADGSEFREPLMLIKTLEGTMAASPGDWIIRGVNNEFYPCKPDIFEKTYIKAEEYYANRNAH